MAAQADLSLHWVSRIILYFKMSEADVYFQQVKN